MLKSIHHVCIETDDYEKSIYFYTKILEFTIIEDMNNFHGRLHNTWIKNNEIIIELQTPKNNQHIIGNIGLVHVCFVVDNLHEYISLLENKGFMDFVKDKKLY